MASVESVPAPSGKANVPVSIVVAAALMVGGLAVAEWMTPHKMMADQLPPIDLPAAVPQAFAGWAIDESIVPVLPDPTVEAKVKVLYTDTLNRTYVGPDGTRIMLSIAYGKNQNSESTAAHRPEFCYSGQGFSVSRTGVFNVPVQGRDLKVVRLMATVDNRYEPITYWVTLGQNATIPGLDRKLSQLKYGLQGWIVDGMLMRVSSLTPGTSPEDLAAAAKVQAQFINDLARAVPEQSRARFFGS